MAFLIPKLAILVLGVHYEPLNSNELLKCECIVAFLLFSYKRLCTVAFEIRHDLSTTVFLLNISFYAVRKSMVK